MYAGLRLWGLYFYIWKCLADLLYRVELRRGFTLGRPPNPSLAPKCFGYSSSMQYTRAFFGLQNMSKCVSGWGSALDPTLGAYDAYPTSLGTFCASILVPLALAGAGFIFSCRTAPVKQLCYAVLRCQTPLSQLVCCISVTAAKRDTSQISLDTLTLTSATLLTGTMN